MLASDDLKSWAAREKLSEKTVQVLVDEEFTTLDDVRGLSADDITETFQKPRLLSGKHCTALRNAVARLSSGTPGSGPQSPTDQGKVYSRSTRSALSSLESRRQSDVSSATSALSSMAVGGSEVDALVTQGSVKERAKQFDRGATGQRWTQESTTKAKEKAGFFSSVVSYWKGNTEEKPKEVFRFILLGKTGSGKSTTGNTILGEKKFDAGMTFSSVTASCEFKSVDKDGKVIEIMDCPGLYDTSKSQAEISTNIVQAVACTHPGPHAVLYVIRLGRFTAEEFGVYNRLKALFDDHVVDYMILVFTGGDDLEKNKTSFADLMKNAPMELVQVLTECKNRCLVFNNNAKDTKPQVVKLLDMVRKMSEEYDFQPYVCPKYGMIGEELVREVEKRLEEVQKRDLEREKYVQELEAKTKEAQTAVEETKKEFERKEEERMRLMEEERERIRLEEEQKREELKAREDQLTKENRALEERLLREQHEREKRELQERLEREREEELEELRIKMEEQKELEEQRRAEEREEERLKREAYEEELRKTKERIAKDEEPGWVGWAANGVSKVVGWLFS